ncbi:MAG: GTPase Era [Cyanobacteriota bacterium]|jgi:predicted GTPase
MDLRHIVQNIVQNLQKYLQKFLFGDQKEMTEDELEKIRQIIKDRVDHEPPPRFAFIGETGVGKSSTLNALFNAGVEVSHTEACTQAPNLIEIPLSEIQGTKGSLIFYDMPGLGESRLKQKEHISLYEKVLKDVDVALWILDAQDRAIASVQQYLETDLKSLDPRLLERMVIALNKVDLLHPGDWYSSANIPSGEQEKNINGRIKDVENKIREVLPNWQGKIVGYSANRRYKLPQLFDAIMDAVPTERQWVVASRKSLADFYELVDPELLPPDKIPQKVINQQAQSSKISDVVNSMSEEDFAKFANNKEAFLAWLKQKENN